MNFGNSIFSSVQTAMNGAVKVADMTKDAMSSVVTNMARVDRFRRDMEVIFTETRDALQERVAIPYRVAFLCLVILLFSWIGAIGKLIFRSPYLCVLTISVVFLIIMFVKRHLKNSRDVNRLATIFVSQGTFLLWSFMTLKNLQTYSANGSVWEIVVISLMYPLTGLISEFESDTTRRNFKFGVIIVTTLASISHLIGMLVHIGLLSCCFDIIRILATNVLMVIFTWFDCLPLKRKIFDVSQIVMATVTTLMSFSFMRTWWTELKVGSDEISKTLSTMNCVSNTYRVVMSNIVEDVSHEKPYNLCKRRISIGNYEFEDAYYIGILVLRCLVFSFMITTVINEIGIYDYRGWMILMAIFIHSFGDLKKRQSFPSLVVMLARPNAYTDALSMASVCFKIRSVYLGGNFESFTANEKAVIEQKIRSNFSPDISEKLLRLEPFASSCIKIYYNCIDKLGQPDFYTSLVYEIGKTGPEIMSVWDNTRIKSD